MNLRNCIQFILFSNPCKEHSRLTDTVYMSTQYTVGILSVNNIELCVQCIAVLGGKPVSHLLVAHF